VDSRIVGSALAMFFIDFRFGLSWSAACDVSLLDDFARMRLYRERASEFELLAESEPLPEVQLRYRIMARHYRELADRDERSDKARIAEHLKLLKLKRQEAAE
jgi:hypothetical protein